MTKNLNRFLTAQENTYEQALSEIKSGRKRSHWMWFIFPQYKGLGWSETSQFYSIQDIDEARSYLHHPILGSRLREISSALLNLKSNDATAVMGSPDDLKLKSCMTLFSFVDTSGESLFKQVLHTFYQGEFDQKTLALLND